MKQIHENTDQNIAKILVANKSDLSERVVDTSEGQRLAQHYQIPHLEVSAKENINIE